MANLVVYSMILFNLVEHPDAYRQVQKEVDALNAKGSFNGTTLGKRSPLFLYTLEDDETEFFQVLIKLDW